jgi:hypothetical protein
MKEIAHFFKHNTESNECFQTSDGMIFYRVNDAIAHSSNLKDREVKEFKRSEVAVEEAEEAESGKVKVEAGAEGGQAGADAGAGAPAAKAPAAKAPKAPKAK